MMLSLNGRESDVDGFAFFLGEKLGKSVTEILDLPHDEYVAWQAYYKSMAAMSNQRKV